VARLRLFVFGALGLGAGVVAYQWAGSDRPYDAPPGPRALDAGPAARVVAPPAPVVPDPPLADIVTLALLDEATQAPLAGAAITAGLDGSSTSSSAIAAADGTALLPVTPGRWHLSATAADGTPLTLVGADDWQLGDTPPPTVPVLLAPGDGELVGEPRAPSAGDPVPPGAASTVDPVPPGAAALVGIATLAGARVADVIVTPILVGDFGPGHAVTLARVPGPVGLPPRRFVGTAGLFRFDGLAPGTYAALIVSPGHGAALGRATTTDTLAGNLSVALSPSASLSGAVTDQRGSTISAATVRVRSGTLLLATTRTTSAGTYAFHDLPPGELTVEARSGTCIGDHAKLTLPAGQRSLRPLGLLCE